MPSEDSEFLAVLVPVALKDALRELARLNDRRLSAEVRRALWQHVAAKTEGAAK